MKRTLSVIAICLAASATVWATEKADDFSILTQCNMFLRDRRPPADPTIPAPATQEVHVADDPPAKSIVLRGVVIEDDQLHAYVEDTRSGAITRLVPGDAVADGRISAIAIDAIAYEQNGPNGTVQWIDVGQNLFGNNVALPPSTAPASTEPANDGSANAAPAPAATPELSALEQRMRQRRARTQTQRTGK